MLRVTSIALLWAIIATNTVNSSPVTDLSMVVSTTVPSKEAAVENTEDPTVKESPVVPKISEMQINTNVSNRFAKTQIASKVKNFANTSQEATFSVVLPVKAYITGFIMEIDGKQYEAYIKEKEEAKKTYDEAVQSGLSAGHVAVSARDSNRFTVSINIEPQSKATFYLTYEELLTRRNNQYEVVLNIHPGQPVQNLNVEVFINETRPLRFVKAPSIRSGNEISKNDDKLDPQAEIKSNKTAATVKFSPDLERQKQLAQGLGTKEENGLSGQFIVQYDVERDAKGGEVLLNDGYFVHFFAPNDLEPLPKQVVFVLDTSGSMDGIRIKQLKEAMNHIIDDLKPADTFNIVEFDSSVKVWDVAEVRVAFEDGHDSWGPPREEITEPKNKTLIPAFPANADNMRKAKQVVDKLSAYGGTNIELALKTGLDLIELSKKEKATQQPIIVFLTDGEPTVGEYNTDKITSKTTELNIRKTPIFSLSFGDGADRSFLQKISLKNLGFARHIYEAADASIQLEDFYKEISSPLLSDVSFKYVSNVTEPTKTVFPILFGGSELIVSGSIDPGFAGPPTIVRGWGVHGPIELTPTVEQPVGSLERLWAYLTLKQILEQRDAAENKTELTKEALKLALKYKFVTDVSSLVVVKPNSTKAVETEDASKSKQPPVFAFQAKNSLLVNRKFIVPNFGANALAGGGSYPSMGRLGLNSAHSALYSAARPAAYLPFDAAAGAGFGGGAFAGAPGGPYLTTPYALPPRVPDSNIVPVAEDSEISESTTQLDDKLAWLKQLVNENGTLTLSKGTFKLGVNETVADKPACPTTPTNTAGVCTLIYDCPQVHEKLTDLNEYEKYFCPLNEFAGVCCPSTNSSTTNP